MRKGSEERFLTLWDVWALHCPKCDNIWDIEWWDGEDMLGLGIYRCPECLSEFTITAKMFKTHKDEHGTYSEEPYVEAESVSARAKRQARE